MVLRFLFRDEASTKSLVHQGVILCNLLDLPVSDQVGTRVTDVGKKSIPVVDHEGQAGGAHALVFEVFLRALVDALAG